MKYFRTALVSLAIFFVLLYSVAHLETRYTITIHRPVEAVWKFASDSSQAVNWSVYFHHITALPGTPDGQPGSIRRCFRRANELGPTWDEEILSVEPLKSRKIRTYNLKGFSDSSILDAEFLVEQRYERVDAATTKMTFGTKLVKPWDPVTLIKLMVASLETRRIFKLNLENIANLIENGQGAARLHLYEEKNLFD